MSKLVKIYVFCDNGSFGCFFIVDFKNCLELFS